MFFDNVCFGKQQPLISEISDQVNRKLQFDYGDYLYKNTQNIIDPNIKFNPDITVTLTSGNDGRNKVFTYKRSRMGVTDYYFNPSNNKYVNREKFYWLLSAYTDDVLEAGETEEDLEIRQEYQYNKTSYQNANPNIPDPNLKEYFSFKHTTKNENTDNYSLVKGLLTDIRVETTKIKYEYERATKYLGFSGYYQTQRVKKRYENDAYVNTSTNKIVWNTAKLNEKTYVYEHDETGYTGSNNFHAVIITQTNGLKTNYQYNDSLLTYLINTDTIKNEVVSNYYDYQNGNFWNQPTKVTTTKTLGGQSLLTYNLIEYNSWGAIFKTSLPMSAAEYADTANRAKYMTTYEYHISGSTTNPIYAIPKKKTWYNDIDGELMTESVTFDNQDRPHEVTNAKGEVTTYSYDGAFAWIPSSIVQTDVNNTHSLLNLDYTKVIQSNDGIYPTAISEKENGVDRTITYTYDFLYDVLKKVTDEDGKETFYNYNQLGQLEEIIYPSIRGVNGNFTLRDYFFYSPAAYLSGDTRLVQMTEAYKVQNNSIIGHELTGYNGYGQPTINAVEKESGWKTQKTEYDSYYREIKHTNFNNQYITSAYDPFNRVTEVTDMQSNKNFIEYGLNTVETYFKGNGQTAENHYLEAWDIRGNTISKTAFPVSRTSSATAITQSYVYNLSGFVTVATDGKGQTTTFEYDNKGQLTKTKYPDTTADQYNTTFYSKSGQPTFDKQIDGSNENRSATIYNERYLPMFVMDSSNSGITTVESYSYDIRGNKSAKTDRKGQYFSFNYDNFGNLITSTTGNDIINLYYSPHGRTEAYTYANHPILQKFFDRHGRTETKYDAGAWTDYTYDDLNNFKTINDPFGFETAYNYNNLDRLETVSAGNKDFVYNYNKDGTIESLTYPTSNIKTSYLYDNANRVTSVVTKKGSAVLTAFTYTYDNNSNIATSKDKNNQTTEYFYDGQNRLKKVIYPTKTVIYTYDNFGNRLTESVTNTTTVVKEYEYKGNQLVNDGEKNFTYDKNGNLLSDGETTYTYDKRNKLISSSKNSTTTSYTYNAEGIRTDKNNKWYHLDEKGRVLAESTYSNGTYLDTQIIWADKPLARKIDNNFYYYIYNAHNDVVALTDESGNIVNSYEYDAWGNLTTCNETIPNPIRFAGEYQDPETGLYYLRARYYDPKIGRFTQEDPARSGKNWYTFCGNNPIMHSDPSGLLSMTDGVFRYDVILQLLDYTDTYYYGKFMLSGSEQDRVMSNASTNAKALRASSLMMEGGFPDLRSQNMRLNIHLAHYKAVELGFKEGSDEYAITLLTYTVALNEIDERGQKKYETTLMMYAIFMVGRLYVNRSNQSGQWNNSNFSSDKKLAEHYKDHKADFGDVTKEEYVQGARNLLNQNNGGDIQGFTTKSGWLFKYNTKTNEFGLGHPEGTISTYFKPKDGVQYWLDQISKYK